MAASDGDIRSQDATRADDRHPAIDVLGRHVTLVSTTSPEGQAYRAVETTDRVVIMQPLLPGRPLPPIGEDVTCVSAAGRWSGPVVEVAPPDRLALALPDWVRRSVRRGAIRVETTIPVEVRTPAGSTGARLEDLSVTGGAMALELDQAPATGTQLWVRLPGGEGTAHAVNVRPHAHPLLAVLGIRWGNLDRETRGWIAETVTSGRLRLH